MVVHRWHRGSGVEDWCWWWDRDREDGPWGLWLCCYVRLCFTVANAGVIAVGSDNELIREETLSD